MSCKKFRTEIEEAGRTASVSAAASAHLAACAPCRAFRSEREALRGLVAELARLDAPADFEFRLRARIARSEDGSQARAPRRTFVPGAAWLAAAGCLVLALGVFVHFHTSGRQESIADSYHGPVVADGTRNSIEVAHANPAPPEQPSTVDERGKSNLAGNGESTHDGERTIARAPRREKFILPKEAIEQMAPTQPADAQLETRVADVKGSPIYVGTPIPLRVMAQEKRLEALFKDAHGAQRVVAIDPVTFGARGQTPSRENMKNISYTGVW
jgi:hypothetical protein